MKIGLTISIGLCLMTTISISYAKGKSDKPYDVEKSPKTNFPLTESISYASRIELEISNEDNFNLDEADPEGLVRIQPQISFTLSYKPNDKFASFINIGLLRNFYDDEETNELKKKKDETKRSIKNAYVEFKDVFDSLNIKLGRMRFKDKREWLYDDELDGLRIKYKFNSNANLEISAFDKKYKDPQDDKGINEQINNYMLYGKYRYIPEHEVRAYYLVQNDRTNAGRNSQLYGVQAYGEWDDFDYWMELGLAGGDEAGNDVDAYGYDLGFIYSFKKLVLKPRIIIGYAFGSGDDNLTDGVDGNYRQSGYQDNASKNGGKERYNVYGEMADIELSNVKISTFGLGFRFHKKTTLDIVYHTYEQHRASTIIRDSEIDVIPNGVNTDLGSALDLVLGHRHNKNLKASLILGYFYPGDAFATNDDALFTELELKYNF